MSKSKSMNYYPNYDDANFDTILNKYEFIENPRQLVIRNLISKNTIYDSILLYHNVGVGKTATSISIAEGFKEYVANMGRKILVLVKNKNIETNFRNELLSAAVRDNVYARYDDEETRSILNINKTNRIINKTYDFTTYGSFVNRVLGLKQFEKDSLGRNTSKQLKDDKGKGLRKKPQDLLTNLNNRVIIIDEAHNVTNNDVYIALEKVLKNSYNYRLVLLTATPMYDNPKEIFEISNLLNMNNDHYIPSSSLRNNLFKDNINLVEKGESNYLQDSILKSGLISVTEKGKELLSRSMLGKVSYLESNKETFPEKRDIGDPLMESKIGTINVVYCNMSDYQYNIYKKALALDSYNTNVEDIQEIDQNNADENIELEKQINGIAKSSSLYKNSSDASTMTFPNNTFGKDGFNEAFKEVKGKLILRDATQNIFTSELHIYSSKLKELLNNINNSPGNAFVYSNYVNQGGTSLIKQLLLANNYAEYGYSNKNDKPTFILYDDTSSPEDRERLRKIFNNSENKDGKNIKVIIGSPVISEGITLKNVNQVHILEPSWNMSRINQIIGRAVRHHSHDDLPLNRRFVEIYKYCSIKNNKKIRFIDKEKYILSEEKDRSNKQIERLLKMIAFDCNINTKLLTNKNNNEKNGLAECDYTNCNYTCVINDKKHIDKFTYNLYIDFFDQFDIELNTNLIKKLFKNYFIWSLDDIVNNIKYTEPMISNESIYFSIKQLIDDKTLISDKYNRSGFLIQKGNYFIFNNVDIDINTSIFSKILDFSKNENQFTLSQYALKENINLKEVKKIETTQEVTKIKKDKEEIEQIKLSENDILSNRNIIENNQIYGSYRKKPIGNQTFGLIDNTFRITDLRKNTKENEDKRKNVDGMAAKSYNKKSLKDIITFLSINIKNYKNSKNVDINSLTITQLIDIIERYMRDHNLILK